MKRKGLLAAIITLALMIVCGGILLVLAFAVAPLSLGTLRLPFRNGLGTVSAKATQQESFTTQGQVTLDLETPFGDIDVTAGEGHAVSVTAEKTAWGANEQEAEQALDLLQVQMVQEGDQIKIQVEQNQPRLVQFQGGSVDFQISVPYSTTVIATTKSGEVTLKGTQGKADLTSDFGNIEVNGVKGGLVAYSRSGKVTARQISLLNSGDGDVSLRSDFGDLILEDTETQRASLNTRSGTVSLTSVSAEELVELNSDFGNLTYNTGQAGELSLNTGSGAINLTGLRIEGAVTARSDFGNIELSDALGKSYDLKTTSGRITVNGATGQVIAKTDNGDINVSQADQVSLTLETKTGSITFRGSLGKGPHQLSSDFGRISIGLPAESAFDFDLQTSFGSIDSEFETQIEGKPDENHWVGQVQGGGELLKAVTRNGDIRLEIAKP